MALNESTLRRIIREEARRVMNESEKPKEKRVNQSVGVAHRDTRLPFEELEKKAKPEALEQVRKNYPDYTWEAGTCRPDETSEDHMGRIHTHAVKVLCIGKLKDEKGDD